MAYNGGNSSGESGNVWSGGSSGGSRSGGGGGGGGGGGYSRSNNDDEDNQGSRGGGSYHGSYGNNYSRGGGGGGGSSGGGGYGFRRQNDDGEVEILKDAIYIQDLPRDVTRDQIQDAFSTVGPIKVDDRSGGPKIWIYKDRMTGEGNGRATVTYNDDETASRAISEYHDQHIESVGTTVRVQLAQRRPRNNDRGDYNSGRGYRGGRSNWDSGNSRQGFGSDSSRWGSSNRGSSDNRRGGGGGGYQSRGGGDSYRSDSDRGGSSYRGSRDGQYRGASRGNGGSSNYSPY